MDGFTIHTLDSAPAGSKPALTALRQRVGFIPNLAATMAGSPAVIQAFGGLQQALGGSSLSGLEREVVGVTVSVENSCAYSVAAHSAFAARNGATGELLAALRSGSELPDGRLEALHRFTRTLLRTRGHLGAADVAAAQAAGYSAEQLLEAITQAAYTSMANWVANVADTPVDEAFQPHAWDAAVASLTRTR